MFSDVEKGCIGNKCVKSAVKASLFSRKRFESLLLAYVILREEFTNTEFFWSVFSHIWTEYGAVRIWEITDQKKIYIWMLF